MLLLAACVPPVVAALEPLLELWEAPVLTPRDCSSVAKSACNVASALCKLGAIVSLLVEAVLEATPLEGVLLVGLVVATGVVVTGVVVTGVGELGDVLADGPAGGLAAALEAADPVAEALVPPFGEDSDEGNAWASWLSPEEMALAGLAAAPSPTAVATLPVEFDCALAACCRATDSASNSAAMNCVSA